MRLGILKPHDYEDKIDSLLDGRKIGNLKPRELRELSDSLDKFIEGKEDLADFAEEDQGEIVKEVIEELCEDEDYSEEPIEEIIKPKKKKEK